MLLFPVLQETTTLKFYKITDFITACLYNFVKLDFSLKFVVF
jgi:hypothetical protein